MQGEGSQELEMQQAGRAAVLPLRHHYRAHIQEEKMIDGSDQGQPTALWLPACPQWLLRSDTWPGSRVSEARSGTVGCNARHRQSCHKTLTWTEVKGLSLTQLSRKERRDHRQGSLIKFSKLVFSQQFDPMLWVSKIRIDFEHRKTPWSWGKKLQSLFVSSTSWYLQETIFFFFNEQQFKYCESLNSWPLERKEHFKEYCLKIFLYLDQLNSVQPFLVLAGTEIGGYKKIIKITTTLTHKRKKNPKKEGFVQFWRIPLNSLQIWRVEK